MINALVRDVVSSLILAGLMIAAYVNDKHAIVFWMGIACIVVLAAQSIIATFVNHQLLKIMAKLRENQ